MAQIRSGFCKTDDGHNLFWQATGSGPNTLICCNGVGVSTFFWKYVVQHFSTTHQVVVWDYRGHGRSDRPTDPTSLDLSIPTSARDLGLVMKAVGSKKAVLFGHSMGCQVALERALQDPEGVLGLVLMQGSAGKVLETFYDSQYSRGTITAIARIANRLGDRVNRIARPLVRSPIAWDVTRRIRAVDPYYTSREDFEPYLEHLADLDLRLFLAMVQEADKHDAFPRLGEIHSPCLVIAAERDDFTPLWLSERMARELPNAELLILADGSHAALIEQPETINHRVDRFFDQRVDWSRGAGSTPKGQPKR